MNEFKLPDMSCNHLNVIATASAAADPAGRAPAAA